MLCDPTMARNIEPDHPIRFPRAAMPAAEVIAAIRTMQSDDVSWRAGRSWMYTYVSGDDAIERLAREAYLASILDNGLSPSAFPSLARMEREVVAMTADLFRAPGAHGNVTSGGTESIFLAMKSARDCAVRSRRLRTPGEIVVPSTAHAAFEKAAQYMGLRLVSVPVGPGWRADVDRMADAISMSTIALVGSAPSFWHGVVDPIQDLARVATERDLWLHVDACIGGFVLPFAGSVDRIVPPFDFSIDGVTSISADVHKYGYAPKGASVVLYRDAEHYRHQRFEGFEYSTPTAAGTRPGGSISGAWAVMNYIGWPGYSGLTRRSYEAIDALIAGICDLPGFSTLAIPDGPMFAFACGRHSPAALAAGLADRGWVVGVKDPSMGLHLTVSAGHTSVIDEFLADLVTVVDALDSGFESGAPPVARYGE